MIRWLWLAVLALALTACGLPPREQARAAVVGTAWAVQSATGACADIVQTLAEQGKPAKKLYDVCNTSWKRARASLLAAESAVDAWDAASAGQVACAASIGLDALQSIVAEVKAAGASIPDHVMAQIEDGVKLAQFLIGLSSDGASCPVPS